MFECHTCQTKPWQSAETLSLSLVPCFGVAGRSNASGGSLYGSSTLPVKDRVVDSASPVYQAVIQKKDMATEIEEGTRLASQHQSKSFRILAHLTGTEYSKCQTWRSIRI